MLVPLFLNIEKSESFARPCSDSFAEISNNLAEISNKEDQRNVEAKWNLRRTIFDE
jgi:hypothetical protein